MKSKAQLKREGIRKAAFAKWVKKTPKVKKIKVRKKK